MHKINQSCPSEVTTPTGKFTFHQEKMSMCEAKKFCAAKGEILAPITNKEDFSAVYKTLLSGDHEGCWLQGFNTFMIGLDITPCGRGKQERFFTNGEAWDQNVHGKLYFDHINSWFKPCVWASIDYDMNQPSLNMWLGCYKFPKRFICLKPADPTKIVSSNSCAASHSEALQTAQAGQSFFAAGLIVCLALFAVFFAFVALRYYKKYRNVEEKSNEAENNLSC